MIEFMRAHEMIPCSEEKKHDDIFDNDDLEQAQRDHHQIPGHLLMNIIRQNFFHSCIYVKQNRDLPYERCVTVTSRRWQTSEFGEIRFPKRTIPGVRFQFLG